MDNFMDKIMQKLSTQDMIHANAEAEAAEMEGLQKKNEQMEQQMEQYDTYIQEMRKLYLKNTENAEVLRELAKNAGEESSVKINMAVETATELSTARIHRAGDLSDEKINRIADASEEKINQTADASQEKINQAAQVSEARINRIAEECLQKITEIQAKEEPQEVAAKLEELKEIMAGTKEHMEGLFKNADDFTHKENVKVYRNMQAAMLEALEKQTKDLAVELEKVKNSSKSILPAAIISMIIGVANLAVLLAHALGLL